MQDIWIEVEATWPTHGPSDRVDTGFSEGQILVYRLEDPDQNSFKVQFANKPIIKRHAKLGANALNFDDSWRSRHTPKPSQEDQ